MWDDTIVKIVNKCVNNYTIHSGMLLHHEKFILEFSKCELHSEIS